MSEFAPYVKALEASELRERVLREQLIATQAREAKLRKQLQRVIGCHNPPNDCYSTGPLTGNEFVDLVSCPSCEAEALLALPSDDSALQERLKQERERCAKVCDQVRRDDGDGQHGHWYGAIDLCTDAIRSMT